ncbi:3-phosphoshikimate 1-carboxyvinyltransferase [Candidatus Parcubacteria bacterium]|nr:3-phosphoshikimate 1-carboxyvinyltransferase [Candidatus Parcubacteria bacterium]
MNVARITPLSLPVDQTVEIPGSKSYSLRALFIAFLCENDIKLSNLLKSDDVAAMQNCLDTIKSKRLDLNAKESGLTARFITALACITPGTQTISGKSSLQKRPIRDLVDALRSLGAEIDYMDKDGFLPLTVRSFDLPNDQVKIPGNVSSQYLSSLLMIAPILKNGLTIEVIGDQISKPYIGMTIGIMNDFGVKVENRNYKKYIIKPQKYIAREYFVESDYSSAGYFFAVAALANSRITVSNLNPESKQADINLLPILEDMGADVQKNKNSVTVIGRGLKPTLVNMENCPDQAMTIAVLAAFAKGKSHISGIGSLRIKETERIKALENELAKMGIKTESTEDSLTIYGGEPKPANIDTYGDHRIAMSFAVAATKLNNLGIFNPESVNKTYPGFWEELRKITPDDIAKQSYKNIVLIGMRGTGKSSVGRMLAKKLGMRFVDVDQFIESENAVNIKQAVKKKGWEYFRGLENQAIKMLTKRSNTVISTGAGAILSESNVRLLRSNNLVFMLKAEPKILSKRITKYDKLPALTKHKSVHDELDEVWQERKNKYYSSCDFIIETENLSLESVVSEIIDKIDK